tara:strand:+ start:240 stop:701 length:462 start_codon:yes stop_codon:yes gene_type:complete
MYLNRTLYALISICAIVCFLNYLKFSSYKKQPILLSDLALNKASLTLNQVNNLNYSYPNLASNSIPMETLIARYYLKYEDYDNATKFAKKGIQANPYLAYTYYLTSRVYIDQNNLQLSLEYLKKAYDLSPNIESVRVLYFTVDNILKNKLNNN